MPAQLPATEQIFTELLGQPRSQGFSLLNWVADPIKGEKPWERGCYLVPMIYASQKIRQ